MSSQQQQQQQQGRRTIVILGDRHVGKTHLAYHLYNCDNGPGGNFVWEPQQSSPDDRVSYLQNSLYDIYEAGGMLLQKIRKIPQSEELKEFFDLDTDQERKDVEDQLNEKLGRPNLAILVVFDIDSAASFSSAQRLLGEYSNITDDTFLIGNSGSGDISQRVVSRDEIDNFVNDSVHYVELSLRDNVAADRVREFRNSHICLPPVQNGQTAVPVIPSHSSNQNSSHTSSRGFLQIQPIQPYIKPEIDPDLKESKLLTVYQEQRDTINSLRQQIAEFEAKIQQLQEDIAKNDLLIAASKNGKDVDDGKDNCEE